MNALLKTIGDLVSQSPNITIVDVPEVASRAVAAHPGADVMLARHLASELIINRAVIQQRAGKSA